MWNYKASAHWNEKASEELQTFLGVLQIYSKKAASKMQCRKRLAYILQFVLQTFKVKLQKSLITMDLHMWCSYLL